MKRNPRAGWTLDEVKSLCGGLGIRCSPPVGAGACCALSHASVEGFLTLPTGRRLKALYVLLVVELAERVAARR